MMNASSAYASEIWQQVIAIIKKDLNEISFKTWFSDVNLDSILQDCVVLTVSSEFNRAILELRYRENIEKALNEVTPRQYCVEIKTVSDKPTLSQFASDIFVFKDSGLLPGYTFDNFIVGDCNRLAAKAAAKIVEESSKFNPLYIYGSTGTGKTHLLHAIGNAITEREISAAVLYIGIDEFINDMIICIREDRFPNYVKAYSTVDVLLIDDLQYIEGKERSQKELCGVINRLIIKGGRVILAANKPPECLSYLNESFSTQFELGAVICLEEPDISVKSKILIAHVNAKGITMPYKKINELANVKYRGVRELKNNINRIIALQELSADNQF